MFIQSLHCVGQPGMKTGTSKVKTVFELTAVWELLYRFVNNQLHSP